MTNKLLTSRKYLDFERRAELRGEWYQGTRFELGPWHFNHSMIKSNIVGEVHQSSKRHNFTVLSSTMRIKVEATESYFYPDILIVCGRPELEDQFEDTLLNPRTIIEIFSDSTEKLDRGRKFAEYRRISTLQEYVLVAQDEVLVELYTRRTKNTWLLTVCSDFSKTIELASVPVGLPLSEIYAGVELSEKKLH